MSRLPGIDNPTDIYVPSSASYLEKENSRRWTKVQLRECLEELFLLLLAALSKSETVRMEERANRGRSSQQTKYYQEVTPHEDTGLALPGERRL